MKHVLVLVVDDVRDNREMYIEYLRFAGFRTLGAEDGETAIELARKHRPAVIVLDLGLPGVGGWEATRILKSDPETASIPIVAVSGHVDESDRVRARKVGCDLFVPKPILPSELTEKLVQLLDTTGRGARAR